MFDDLKKIAKKFTKLNVDELAYKIARTKEHQFLVISLNTEGQPTSQLFNKGEDSFGVSLESIGGGYSDYTKDIKQAKGQPIDRVTLKDTGKFYKTWIVVAYRGGFIMNANPIKDEGPFQTDLFKEWGEDIVGLNEENLQILINYYASKLVPEIQKNLI